MNIPTKRIDYSRNAPLEPSIGLGADNFLGLGNVYYVDNSGQNKNHIPGFFAYSTIVQALEQCVSGRGDIIHVLPGHVEPVVSAAALDFNKAGVTVIGHGRKDNRAKIDVTTVNTAYVKVSAKDVAIFNIDFRCRVDALAKLLMVAADGLHLENCRFLNWDVADECVMFISCTDLSLTDLASADPWTTITSATGGFTADMVGHSLEITGAGTNFSTGRYTISAVNSSTSITVTSAAGSTGAASSGVGSISVANDVTIKNCEFRNVTTDTAAATQAIEIAGMVERWTIQGNYFLGSWSVSCVSAITLKSYEVDIVGNDFNNAQTGNVAGCVDLIAACTGRFDGNKGFNGYTSAINCFDIGSLRNGLNYGGNELAKYPLAHGSIDS